MNEKHLKVFFGGNMKRFNCVGDGSVVFPPSDCECLCKCMWEMCGFMHSTLGGMSSYSPGVQIMLMFLTSVNRIQ